MADTAEKDINPRFLFAVIGGALLFLWFLLEVSQFRLAQRIDLAKRCEAGATGQCFTDEAGRITAVESDRVTVAYDDGRKSVKVTLAADSAPEPGERVRLERWDGRVVSVYVPGRERRYRSIYWPRRWNPYTLWIGVVGALCVVAAVEGRLRGLRQAARSNGKPWRSRRRSKSRR